MWRLSAGGGTCSAQSQDTQTGGERPEGQPENSTKLDFVFASASVFIDSYMSDSTGHPPDPAEQGRGETKGWRANPQRAREYRFNHGCE